MADADRTRRVKDDGLRKTNSTETQHLQTGCFNALSTRRPHALEDAVSDGYLVPAKAVSVPLKFQRFGLGLGGMVCPCLITETKRLGPFLLQRSLCWEPRFNQSLALPKVIPRKPLALDYRLQRTPAFSSSSLALCCANQVS